MKSGMTVLLAGICLLGTAQAQATRWETLNARLLVLHRQGDHKKAISVGEEALALAEQWKDQARIALSENNLGLLHKTVKDYERARSHYYRALTIGIKTRGEDHISVAQCLNNLAVLYDEQDQFTEAESLYRRAIRGKESVLGQRHLSVALSVCNLAQLYHRHGYLAKAEPLYRICLSIRQEQLGPRHPLVVQTRRQLTSVFP